MATAEFVALVVIALCVPMAAVGEWLVALLARNRYRNNPARTAADY